MSRLIRRHWVAFIAILLSVIVGGYFILININTASISAETRTVKISDNALDYQSVLDEFDNSEIKTEDNLTTFTGYKRLDADMFNEIDNVSETDIEEFIDCQVFYKFTYDVEENIVTVYAYMSNDLGEIELDTISGIGFINDDGEIDAVMNIDGDGILLSEMRNAGMIQNCGFLSNLIRAVVKVVAVVAVVAVAAVACVYTAGAAAPALVAAGMAAKTATVVAFGAGTLFGAATYSVGMAAVKAGTAFIEKLADGLEKVIDKATGSIRALIISGIEYATTKITQKNLLKSNYGEYRFLLLKNDSSVAYITNKTVSRTIAVWGLRLGLSTYSSQSDAYIAATNAGNGISPRQHSKHNYDINGRMKKGVYFDHYHAYPYSVTYDALGFEIPVGHACYGTPSFN